MYIAKTKNNKRIYIEEALKDKNEEYFCPQCNGELVIKDGDINVSHFAHKSLSNCDDFSHDMSVWHRTWQERFPEENREVVINYKGEIHRADICIDNYVIEFQHSPISRDEFNRRCEFYTSAGYKLIWVFDHSYDVTFHERGSYSDYDEDWKGYPIIGYEENGYYGGTKYQWKRPARFMCDFIPQFEKNIKIIFQTCTEEILNEGGGGLERICWAINSDGESNFSRFFTDVGFDLEDFIERAIDNDLFS